MIIQEKVYHEYIPHIVFLTIAELVLLTTRPKIDKGNHSPNPKCYGEN